MLVLSRKSNEQIRIGEEIVITVVKIRGDKVRLGIDAPSSVPIWRPDVHHQSPPDQTFRPQRKTDSRKI